MSAQRDVTYPERKSTLRMMFSKVCTVKEERVTAKVGVEEREEGEEEERGCLPLDV